MYAIVLYTQHPIARVKPEVDFFLQHTPKGTPPPSPSQKAQAVIMPDLDQGEGPKADLDLCIGPKDAYVVEVKLIIPFSSNFV